ncbi:acyltransferase family protein [Fibrivirga algicola]|uniref:Acyltransferase n=1 Tax=Fibrivirga algicola TaxID=2950420 RepID=A0ABX0QG37_9BACT|nr:acyltransferase [Fibrivirga algicola]NID10155.1 acyltransferase [Fibrivirga algicola]
MGLLRFLLALAVVAGHCDSGLGIKFMNGQIAVQSFYIISGFYISLILNEKYVHQPNAYWLFISNRLLRLFPLYWAVLLATFLFSITFSIVSHSHDNPALAVYSTVQFNPFSLVALILSNIFIIGQDLIMFMGINPEDGHFFLTANFWGTKPPLHSFLLVPQAWTLALELMFYAMAPFLVRRGYKSILLFVAGSLAIRLLLYTQLGLTNDPWTYRFFPNEIMFFLLGTLSYKLFVELRNRPVQKNRQLGLYLIVITLTSLYAFIPAGRFESFPFSIREVAYFALLIGTIPYLFMLSNRYAADSHIGELSFPIYITHILIILVIHKVHLPWLNQGWIIVLITIAASYLLNRFVSIPVEKIRQARVAKPAAL